MKKKQIYIGPKTTLFREVLSMQVFRVSDSEMVLGLVGYLPTYSKTESDIFCINELLDMHKINYKITQKKETPKTKPQQMQKQEPEKLNEFQSIVNRVLNKMEYLISTVVNKKFSELETRILRISKRLLARIIINR
jgi:hypothetical protein